MSTKRSRRSASVGEIDFYSLSTHRPANQTSTHHSWWQEWMSPFKKLRSTPPDHSQEHQTSVKFILQSPAGVPVVCEGSERGQNCNFMDRCYYCNSKLPVDRAVFMYRDFGAFCKAECREKQVAQDGGDIDIVKLKDQTNVQQKVSRRSLPVAESSAA